MDQSLTIPSGHIAQIGGYCDDQAANRGVGVVPGKQQALHRTEALRGNALLADVKIGLLQCRIVKQLAEVPANRAALIRHNSEPVFARDTAPARSAGAAPCQAGRRLGSRPEGAPVLPNPKAGAVGTRGGVSSAVRSARLRYVGRDVPISDRLEVVGPNPSHETTAGQASG